MKILIADDESLARERARELLSGLPGAEVAGEASNGREAVERCAELKPDILLLDIAMPVLDGLEAARHVASLDTPPAVIFCTAYDEHALAAFDAGAIDYLVKPIRRERLAQALERAARITPERANELHATLNHGQRRTHLCARLRGALRMIALDDVRYLQAEDKYIVVHHARGEDLIEESLRSLEKEFGERFLRIHRNCLVAAGQIREIRRHEDGRVQVLLRDSSDVLDASRRSLPSLRQRLKAL